MPSPTETLTGAYQLHPGAQTGLTGHRPVLQAGRLAQLLRGHAAQQIPELLGSVFTLCGHAHRRAARQALDLAATPQDAPVFHLLETARDHLRSMALDWPQRLPGPDAGAGIESLRWLATCPLSMAGPLRMDTEDAAWATLAALRVWLVQHILQTDVTDWLRCHHDNDALTEWCQQHAARLLPARCLAHWLGSAPLALPAARRLDILHTDPAQQTRQLVALGQCIAGQPAFAQYPTWLGLCAENGPWTRLRHRDQPGASTLAQRLASRWVDLLELACVTPGTPVERVLSMGTLALGNEQTLAWCEMARGLLLHWVHRDAAGTVQDYKVIAPTEWNFHPQGTLSRAVSALQTDDTLAALALAAAFDPCVACSV